MKTIHKYRLPLDTTLEIDGIGVTASDHSIPVDAKLLSVQVQQESIMLWALVDPAKQTIRRTFAIFGTDHPIPDSISVDHVGTVQMVGGRLIWHIFEIHHD